MKNQALTLRYYVKRGKSQWVAICIDLSLAAQANSREEAIKKLESMIHSYVEDTLGKHREYAEQLLSRKAPLSQKIFYHWSVFQQFLSKIFHYKNRNQIFLESYRSLPRAGVGV